MRSIILGMGKLDGVWPKCLFFAATERSSLIAAFQFSIPEGNEKIAMPSFAEVMGKHHAAQATQTQVGMYLSHYRLKCTASQQLSSSNVEVQNPYRSVYEVKILFEICSFCRLFFSKNWTCIHNRFVYNVAITVCRSICQVLAFLFSLGVIDNLFIKEYFEISLQNLMLVMS